MEPWLFDGDVVIVHPGRKAAVDDVVVCGHPFRSIDVVKVLASDVDSMAELWSPSGDDSRRFGRPSLDSVRGVVTFNLTRKRPVRPVPTSERDQSER